MIVNKKESNTFNQNILNQIGNTDISEIGDGTLTGSISELNNAIELFKIKQMKTIATLKNTETYTVEEDCLVIFVIGYSAPTASGAIADSIKINSCIVLYNNMSDIGYFNYASQPIRVFKGDIIEATISADFCTVAKLS